jgi:hypothetical protein
MDLRKLVTLFASCQNTAYSGKFVRNIGSLPNPALTASGYTSADSFKHDYFLYNLVRKLNTGGDKSSHDLAIKKFIETDSKLREVRGRLNWRDLALNEPAAHKILLRAKTKVLRLLGRTPDLQQVFEHSSFSHGASAHHKRTSGEAPFKYALAYPEVTPQALPLLDSFIQRVPLWRENVKGYTLCEFNRVTTVPKDATIDRPIACEPTLNMYAQKGVGAIFRRLLKSRGVDLNDQTVNQRLAFLGSLTGRLATVDLSAASDSISIEIVKLLLPEAWYDLLLLLRCDKGLLPSGEFIVYNKISSMGNGFTFELESLLFWAITQACEDSISEHTGGTHRCSVYGDDIICRTETVPLLTEVLATCGFSVNVDKTFSDGPFRESCGKHYFQGVDVTPVYVRTPVRHVTQLFLLANSVRRWMRGRVECDDPRYTKVYRWIVNHLPEALRYPTIPDGQGDGSLFGRLDEVKPHFRFDKRKGCYIYRARTLRRVRCLCSPRSQKFDSLVSAYKGIGGYLSALSLSQEEVCIDPPLHFCNVDGLVEKVRDSKPLTFDTIPIPGAYKFQSSSLKMYEWSD